MPVDLPPPREIYCDIAKLVRGDHRMPKLMGRQAVIGLLASIMPSVKGIQGKHHIVEGDYVATVFDIETVNGVDHVFDRIHIVDGEISRIHAFYYLRCRTDSSTVVRKLVDSTPLGNDPSELTHVLSGNHISTMIGWLPFVQSGILLRA